MHQRQTESPEVFDRAQAMDSTSGDPELLREIVGIFLDDFPRLLSDLRRAVAAKDADGTHRAAHTLKGSVAVLGAKALAVAAKEVEDRARAGQPAAAAFARVEEEAKRLLPVLRGLLAG